MDITLSNLPPAATEAWITSGARGEPFRLQGEVPPGAAMLAVANQQVTIAGVPDGNEGQAFLTDGVNLLAVRNFCAGFTRQRPRLDALVPNAMQVNTGRQLLRIEGRGLSISNELHFGSAGQKEPVRPDWERKAITTYVETDLWAPGQQPVWVVNAGTKSNVLIFEFAP